jgi:hypothetical protein
MTVIHYSTFFKEVPGALLPVLQKSILSLLARLKTTFEDAYPENRMLSLMHYWLLNMEQLDGNIEPLKSY